MGLLFILFIVCTQLFGIRQKYLGKEHDIPDVRFHYDAETIHKVFVAWGRDKCWLYSWTQLTLDTLFPLVYGSCFFLVLVKLFPAFVGIWIIMVGTLVIADLGENSLLAYAATHLEQSGTYIALASYFTKVKFVLFSACMAVILLGSIYLLFNKAVAIPSVPSSG